MHLASPNQPHDIAIIGGGIVGLATAMALTAKPGLRVIVLEKEERLASHQTGHNSGVIHAGLYYKPGSLRARLCAEGREALYRLCEREGIAHRRCGKLVVAIEEDEFPRLAEIEERGTANGLKDLRRLSAAELCEIEPHAEGIAALHVQETGVVNFGDVATVMADRIQQRGGEIRLGAKLLRCHRDGNLHRLVTSSGEVTCRALINCAGLHADRVAKICGARPPVRLIPFRGEYWEIGGASAEKIKALIYPVPDPRFPFLGVHLTRTIEGKVEAGPNAHFSLSREGYAPGGFSLRDSMASLTFAGLWRFGIQHWRLGLDERRRSKSMIETTHSIRRLVPAVEAGDLRRGSCGIRAQAMDARGELIDDFLIIEGERALHVLNAPSPAATASIAIGESIAATARDLFPL